MSLSRNKSVLVNVTRLGDFFVVCDKFSYKRSPNIWWHRGLFYNTLLLKKKLLWLLFRHVWKYLGYFFFQHLVTLVLVSIHLTLVTDLSKALKDKSKSWCGLQRCQIVGNGQKCFIILVPGPEGKIAKLIFEWNRNDKTSKFCFGRGGQHTLLLLQWSEFES